MQARRTTVGLSLNIETPFIPSRVIRDRTSRPHRLGCASIKSFGYPTLFLITAVHLLLFFVAGFNSVRYNLSLNYFQNLGVARTVGEQAAIFSFGLFSGIICFCIILAKFLSIRHPKYLFVVFVYASLFFLFHLMVTPATRPMSFFGPLMTVVVFGFGPTKSARNGWLTPQESLMNGTWQGRVGLALITVYLVAPFLLFVAVVLFTGRQYFPIENAPQLILIDSFRGFALDRVQYSFLAGLLAIVLLAMHRSRLLISILLIAIIMTQSRSALTGMIVALVVLFADRFDAKRIFMFLGMFILVVVMTSIIATRPDLWDFSEDFRVVLITRSIEKIFSSGLMPALIGQGDFYALVFGVHQPHNSVLQSMLDFGAVVTVPWFILLVAFYRRLSRAGRAVTAYATWFGLFHAGFSAFLFVPMSAFAYLLGLMLSIPSQGLHTNERG